MKIFSILPAIALLVASPMAYGVIVYDNGGPDQENGNECTEWLQADNFQLASPATIGAAEFWTGEDGPWDGTLNWWIFNNDAGQPGSILASGAGAGVTKVATGTQLLFGVEYKYDFSLAGVPTLAAGTTYWFGIHLSSDWNRDEIYWETTAPTSGNGHESDGGTMDNWGNNGLEHAFNLSGVSSVPDACSTAMLLGLALTFLGVARRRGKA